MPITYHHHEPPPSSAPHALPAQREMSKPALNKNTPSIVAVTDDYSTYGENAEMWHVSVTHAGTDGDGNSWEVLVRGWKRCAQAVDRRVVSSAMTANFRPCTTAWRRGRR